jgi:hypothetical protein
MKKRLLWIIPLFVITITACSQNQTGSYYWDKYSHTQYAYLKNPSLETLDRHITTLEKIISVSRQRGLKVPPGVYSELAMMKWLKHPEGDVSEYLLKEVNAYPESQEFINFLILNLFAGSEVHDEE